MFIRINIALLEISNNTFAIRRCFCVSPMTAFIFLICESTRDSKCEQHTLFLPSTTAHNTLITVFVVEI